MSLMLTILVVVDRWIAVKYCLQYNSLVSRWRINCIIAILVVINTCILGLCSMNNTSTGEGYFIYKTTKKLVLYNINTRSVTCFVIIFLGKSTKRIRDKSLVEIEKQSLNAVHGKTAERLKMLRSMKKGLRDMGKFNFWTCIFLMPLIVMPLATLVEIGIEKKFVSRFVVLSTSVHSLSNPIIYIASFNRIRPQFLRCKRIRVAVEM